MYVTNLGPKGQGKTTLTAAMVKVLSDEEEPFLPEEFRPETGLVARLGRNCSYPCGSSHVEHIDLTGQDLFEERFYLFGEGTYIIVYSLEEYTQAEALKYLQLARKLKFSSLAIFVNQKTSKVDEELLDIALSELQALLISSGWGPKEVPIFCGNALKAFQSQGKHSDVCAPIHALAAFLGSRTKESWSSPLTLPFLMPIEVCFSINGRTIVAGRIEQGIIRVGDRIELMATDTTRTKQITQIEMYRKPLRDAQAGDTVGLTLAHTPFEKVQRGQVLTASNHDLVTCQQFQAFIHFYAQKRARNQREFEEKEHFQFYIKAGRVGGKISLSQDTSFIWDHVLAPEMSVVADVVLSRSCIMQKKSPTFGVRKDGIPVGWGVIIS